MQVRVGGLLLDGTENPDAKYTLEPDSSKALFGGVGVRDKAFPRDQGHGDHDGNVWREGRRLPFTGHVLSNGSIHGQEQDLQALVGVLADGEFGDLTAQTEVGSRWCRVKFSSVETSVLVPGRVAKYRLVFAARNPRLYGERNEFVGSAVDVHHYGNFPADPVVTVAGPRTAPYTVSGPNGRRVVVSQPLTASQSHRIDFGAGAVFRNGVRQLGAVTTFEPWTVPAGRVVPMSISSGSMTVTVVDTYM